MKTSLQHEVMIYHDETKNVDNGQYKGHILFFIPNSVRIAQFDPQKGTKIHRYSPLENLFQQITEIRNSYSMQEHKFHFCNVSGQKWTKYDIGYRLVIEKAVAALKYPSLIAENGLHCKMAVIFYPRKSDLSFYSGDKKERLLRYDETQLRYLLKGAAHLFYNENNPIIVREFVTDGEPSHRLLDNERIVQRLLTDQQGRQTLRHYVNFAPDFRITHLPLSNHTLYPSNHVFHTHANMLQVADLLLGSAMRSCYQQVQDWKILPSIGDRQIVKKDVLAYPMREMLDNCKRDSYYGAAAVSKVSYDNSKPEFERIYSKAS